MKKSNSTVALPTLPVNILCLPVALQEKYLQQHPEGTVVTPAAHLRRLEKLTGRPNEVARIVVGR